MNDSIVIKILLKSRVSVESLLKNFQERDVVLTYAKYQHRLIFIKAQEMHIQEV